MNRQHGYSWDSKKSEELVQMMSIVGNQLVAGVDPTLEAAKPFTQEGVVFAAPCTAMEISQECYNIMCEYQEVLKTKAQEVRSFCAAFAEQYNIVLQENFNSSSDAMDRLRKTVATIKEA